MQPQWNHINDWVWRYEYHWFRAPARFAKNTSGNRWGKVINMEITLFHDLKILINWICVVYCLEHVRLRFDINMIIISCLIKRDSRRVSISLRFCFKSYFSIFLSDVSIDCLFCHHCSLRVSILVFYTVIGVNIIM